ncbi:kinase-like protein [Byssothecium circinans]|uniref:Kinase-like protein n=1 Tax=Byssothecium circinans TaxID=147558 RepID=A0A6A5U7Q2_9PLEO|nr:kinase-like protein [Byssothecium circinans]
MSKAQDPVLVSILPPALFTETDMDESGILSRMLAVFFGESHLRTLRSFVANDIDSSGQDQSGNLMLLSPAIFKKFMNGRLALERTVEGKAKDLQGRTVWVYQVAKPCCWSCIASGSPASRDAPSICNRPGMARGLGLYEEEGAYCHEIFSGVQVLASTAGPTHISNSRKLLDHTPKFVRVFAYKRLITIGHKLYNKTGSDRVHRLPFNLYVRIANRDWAPKHQAEYRALQLIEKHTRIPAPRAIDTLHSNDTSFLLMTGLPGEIVGRHMHTMTDEQLVGIVKTLRAYIAEMRTIPKAPASEYQICNVSGGGIQDWRVGDSQRKELRFRTEAEFNDYLTYDLPLDEDARHVISKSYDVKHDAVFTHADLNMRNILVNQEGEISGIVDWECAGWYPEYWEYTKMHFGARSTARWIVDVIDEVFPEPEYRDELKAEDLLSSLAPSW